MGESHGSHPYLFRGAGSGGVKGGGVRHRVQLAAKQALLLVLKVVSTNILF